MQVKGMVTGVMGGDREPCVSVLRAVDCKWGEDKDRV